MAQSFTLFNRLANAERLFEGEKKKTEAVLIELEAAKNVAAVAEAEKQEVLQHELKTIEENKVLTRDCARLNREVEQAMTKISNLEAEMAELKAVNVRLRGEVEDAGRTAIAEFKNTDDYQAVLYPVFMQGFDHAKAKFSSSFPELNISTITPGDSSDAPEEQGEMAEGAEGVEGAEGDVPAEVVSGVIAKVTAEVIGQETNVTDEAGDIQSID